MEGNPGGLINNEKVGKWAGETVKRRMGETEKGRNGDRGKITDSPTCPVGSQRLSFGVPRFPGSRRRGFTLLELMVVVIIIGIMMAVAIPKFAGHRKRTSVKLASRSVTSVARLARSRAMAERKYYLAIFDSAPDSEGRCHIWVQKGQGPDEDEYLSKDPVFGTEKVLPKGVVMDSTSTLDPVDSIYYCKYTSRGTGPLSKHLRLWDGTGNEYAVWIYSTGEVHIEEGWR